MHEIFESYYDRLQALHQEFEAAIASLSPDALTWVPGPEMNSIGVLVAHTMGAERYWIGDVVGNEPSGRVREQEFQHREVDEDTLRSRLTETLAHSRLVLERLTPQDLTRVCTSPRVERPFHVAWSLNHALEHTAQHTGHVQLMRQLWEQRG